MEIGQGTIQREEGMRLAREEKRRESFFGWCHNGSVVPMIADAGQPAGTHMPILFDGHEAGRQALRKKGVIDFFFYFLDNGLRTMDPGLQFVITLF